ncbi:MAG: ATP-dependent DNA ligase [Candidatus Daviesbacteria bacterium]|nr:ATP-dependent DNA ligase [Candidatus Daviesbacteria bacterium]
MRFSKLAEYLEKLEATPSRLSLINILSELFLVVEEKEIAKVVYLISGRVAPFYLPIEMGMAEKNIAASIARAYGVEREEVLRRYGQVGDLGKVAEELSSKLKIQSSKLEVSDVFNTLLEIAKSTGEGTVEKKVSALSGLLIKVDPISVKHLVRIPLGTSRLGIGDPTILDGFAQSKLGDRKNRKVLEGAYNKTSDLGLIGETLWREGQKGVEKLDVTVGRPIRSQLAERLPDPKTILEKFAGVAHVQFKYDGFRVQIHKQGKTVRLFSRNLEETTLMFPELIEGTLNQIKANEVILDSEALAFNPESEEFLPFQETTKRRRKYGIEEMQKKLPLKAFVFDIMYLDGKSLINTPLKTRMELLKKTIAGDEILKIEDRKDVILIPQPGEITDSVERVDLLFNDALSKGLEGLIVKRPDSVYEAGARNFNWVKLKRHSSGELQDTIDCVILGYVFGRGKRADFGAGALLVGVYDQEKDEFVTVSKIGTGLTDEEWREIHKRADKIKVDKKPARVNSILEPSVWVKPEIVIEVLADEITRSPVHTAGKSETEPGYALRFPRLVRFREGDKRPEDSTTVDELVKLFGQQFKK